MSTVQEMNKKQYENELKVNRLYEDVHVESSTKDSCKLEAQVAVKLVILGKAAEGKKIRSWAHAVENVRKKYYQRQSRNLTVRLTKTLSTSIIHGTTSRFIKMRA
jgi:hypothetical protein